MDYRLKALVEALALEREGNEETLQHVEALAKEQGLPLEFWLGNSFYNVGQFGPQVSVEGQDGKWDIDHEFIDTEEYLEAIRGYLLGVIAVAKSDGDKLRAILQGFLSKQVTFRELKEALQ